jgi:hypothetical protein
LPSAYQTTASLSLFVQAVSETGSMSLFAMPKVGTSQISHTTIAPSANFYQFRGSFNMSLISNGKEILQFFLYRFDTLLLWHISNYQKIFSGSHAKPQSRKELFY